LKIIFFERNDPLPLCTIQNSVSRTRKKLFKYQNAINYAPNALNISKDKLKRIDKEFRLLKQNKMTFQDKFFSTHFEIENSFFIHDFFGSRFAKFCQLLLLSPVKNLTF